MNAPAPARRWRGWLWQAALLLALALLVGWLARNTAANMAARGIQGGYDFLGRMAGFDIGDSPIAFDSTQAYGRAFAVGVLNTLRVALPGVVLATLLGAAVALARLSPNALLRTLGTAWVDALRNVPLLLQLLLAYFLFTELLPPVDAPRQWAGVQLDKNGVMWGEALTLTPEFLAVLLALALYTSAFVAEVFRAGLLAVPRAQTDAALALGLTRGQTLRAVVLPQALRVIVPPLTNQFLNLTKNSSLAVAVGYPDLVSIANTSLNQTGRAVECLSLVMAVYLVLSLLTAAAMHAVNHQVARREHR